MRIKVDDGQNEIRKLLRMLTVADKLFVVDGVEFQVSIPLQSGILFPNPIHPSYEILQTARVLQVPSLDLVFVRVQILLLPNSRGVFSPSSKAGP